jgi:hypothetical protein
VDLALFDLDTLRLVDIFALALPIIFVSGLLVLKTNAIRSLQRRYNIQMVLFRDILAVGYLFIFAGVFYMVEDVSEWYGNELYEEVSRVAFHALALVIIIAVTVSFYHYYRLISHEPSPEAPAT